MKIIFLIKRSQILFGYLFKNYNEYKSMNSNTKNIFF